MPKLIVTQRPGIPNSRPLTPADAGAGTGRALQRFGQSLGNAVSNVTSAIQANQRIKQAAEQTRARRNAVEFGIALQGRTAEINANPDVDSREREFESARKELISQFRPQGAAGEFDFQARVSGERSRNELTNQVRQDRLSNIRADGEFQVNAFAEEAATATDPADMAMGIIKGELEIQHQLATGALNQSQADKRTNSFRNQVQGAVIRRLENDDPVEGLAFVQSDQFSGTEEEKQVYRSRLISASEQKLRHSNAAHTAIDRAQSLEDKRLTKVTTSRWIKNLENGILPQPSEVSRAAVFLPASTALAWQKRALSGGVEQGPSDAKMLAHFTLRAEKGDDPDLVDEVDEKYASGEMKTAERNAVMKVIGDRQFGAGMLIMDTAIKALSNNSIYAGQVIAVARAKADYMEWMQQNPSATIDEARKSAARFYKKADPRGLSERGAPKLASDVLIKDESGHIEIDLSEANLAKLSKRMTEDQKDAAMKAIDDARVLRDVDESTRRALGDSGQ